MPRIINTFIESYSLNGKTIVPFATSIENSVKELKEQYAGINWHTGKLLNGGTSDAIQFAKEVITVQQ